MENIETIYDDTRQGDTTQGYAEATSQTKNSQAEISGASKWARRIFTTLAIAGWIIIGVLILDAMINNSKLIIWLMIGQ